MPPSRRAKQFAPFDALKGLKEAIAEKERIPTPRRILSEDSIVEISAQLTTLKPGNIATVCTTAIMRRSITRSPVLFGRLTRTGSSCKLEICPLISAKLRRLRKLQPLSDDCSDRGCTIYVTICHYFTISLISAEIISSWRSSRRFRLAMISLSFEGL